MISSSLTRHLNSIKAAAFVACLLLPCGSARAAELNATVVDRETGQPLAARVYLRPWESDSEWLHVMSRDEGPVVPYKVIRGESVEVHTTVSAAGFRVELPSGRYQITIERGKEYLPLDETIEVGDQDLEITFELVRWANMAELGWYSGETHVHRPASELPLLQQAEDLNVAFPLAYWVTDSEQAPVRDPDHRTSPEGELVTIDETHVFWPTNTEYEIFTIKGQSHTLGAIFFLNHRERLEQTAPPIGPIAEAAREQSGEHGPVLTDLDKHNWPWSMMLIPIAKIDLYELTNNHVWRTRFLFNQWYPTYVPSHFNIDRDDEGNYTERGWIDYGLETYYLLLNCGFRLRPTAGTASGVHPVPLGFGRVYVHLGEEFSYRAWVDGLSSGRSFVTTGPMLDLRFNGELPGATFPASGEDQTPSVIRVQGWIESPEPIESIELVVSGQPRRLNLEPSQTEGGTWRTRLDETVRLDDSAWLAVRCFAKTADGRLRFAHTGPVYQLMDGQPIRPNPEEVQFLVRRMQEEIERHTGVLSEQAIDEYREAFRIFRRLRHEE